MQVATVSFVARSGELDAKIVVADAGSVVVNFHNLVTCSKFQNNQKYFRTNRKN